MAINRNFTPNAEDFLRYSQETGQAEGSKANQVATLEGRERQGARAQDASIAAAQFGQHAADRAANLQQQQADNAARLRANAMDNAAQLQGEALRAKSAEAARLAGLNEIEMRGDVDARNKALEGGGLTVPDATEGPLQNYDIALANNELFQTATARDRHALQAKFQAGDMEAIQSALSAGRAKLSRGDQAAYQKAQAALSKADNDQELHPQQRVTVQKQMALQMQGILKRAEWLPDERQPKSLQEQAQSRVVTLTDEAGKARSVFLDEKGKPTPLHDFDQKPVPDPNAPKPAKVLSEDEKKVLFRKQYNEAFKALTVVTMQGETKPSREAVLEHMKAMDSAYDSTNDKRPTGLEKIVGGLGAAGRAMAEAFNGKSVSPAPSAPQLPAATPKFDATMRPATAPPKAVYVHSNDQQKFSRLKGPIDIYDEHGKLWHKGK